MKIENLVFQAWKVMEFSSQSWKSKAVYVKLVIEVVKARKIMTKKSNLTVQMPHILVKARFSICWTELFKKKYLKQG